jgi:2-aminoadipate transaminase
MRFAKRTKVMKASEIRELLTLTERMDVISFGGGMPNPLSFPIPQVKKIVRKILAEKGKEALQYGTTEGLTKLRKELIKRMRKYGIKCSLNEITITTGSQQALDLIAKIFLDPKDYVVVELPTYLGAICAFNPYQVNYIPIEMDENGMKTDELEKKLKRFKKIKKVKLIYTVPTFQNPTGITMSLERRKHLLEIAEKFGIPIVEDDAYRELIYDDKLLPPLKSLDKKGLVIYLSTFSKILSPGFRLGWVIANKKITRKIVIAKQGADLCSNVFSQYIAYEYLKSGFVDKQIKKIRKMYKRKRNIMLKALQKYFPPGAKWTEPNGGLFIWVELPKKFNTRKLFNKAIKKKVAFVHGAAFFVDARGKNTMRLNFSNSSDKDIVLGIKRLAKVIKSVK